MTDLPQSDRCGGCNFTGLFASASVLVAGLSTNAWHAVQFGPASTSCIGIRAASVFISRAPPLQRRPTWSLSRSAAWRRRGWRRGLSPRPSKPRHHHRGPPPTPHARWLHTRPPPTCRLRLPSQHAISAAYSAFDRPASTRLPVADTQQAHLGQPRPLLPVRRLSPTRPRDPITAQRPTAIMLPAAPCRPPRRCPFVNGVLSCPRRQTDRHANAIANANAKRTPATPGVLLLRCAGFRLPIHPSIHSFRLQHPAHTITASQQCRRVLPAALDGERGLMRRCHTVCGP